MNNYDSRNALNTFGTGKVTGIDKLNALSKYLVKKKNIITEETVAETEEDVKVVRIPTLENKKNDLKFINDLKYNKSNSLKLPTYQKIKQIEENINIHHNNFKEDEDLSNEFETKNIIDNSVLQEKEEPEIVLKSHMYRLNADGKMKKLYFKLIDKDLVCKIMY